MGLERSAGPEKENEITALFNIMEWRGENGKWKCCTASAHESYSEKFAPVLILAGYDSFPLFISYHICLSVSLFLPTPPSLSLSLHFFISLFLFISLYLFIPFPNHVLSQQYFHLQRPHDWINSISDSFVSDRDRDSNFRASWMYCLDPKWTAVVSFSYFMTGGLGSFIFKNI